jgi:hypothetical protein
MHASFTHTYMHTNTNININTCMQHTYIQIQIHACIIHTYIHTYIPSKSKSKNIHEKSGSRCVLRHFKTWTEFYSAVYRKYMSFRCYSSNLFVLSNWRWVLGYKRHWRGRPPYTAAFACFFICYVFIYKRHKAQVFASRTSRGGHFQLIPYQQKF